MKVWWLAFIGGLAVLVLIAVSIALMYGPPLPAPSDEAAASAPSSPKETAHITATLFFGSPDGQGLVPVRRDVPLAESVIEQGREILIAQLAEVPPPPYVNVIPAGTMLRAFYVTERGDAFVDLSSDVVRGHPGGSLNELLTVYAIVNAVSANLPAARRVQILVDGMEADTLAGHVDLRRPLTRNDSLVRETDEK
jgi:Sporulation and spore germination